MSTLVTLPCPVTGCPNSYYLRVAYSPGDWVPWGSATVQTPGGYETEVEADCPLHPVHSLPDADFDTLTQQAVDQAADDQADYDPREDREDVP